MRQRAKELVALINDPERMRAERHKASPCSPSHAACDSSPCWTIDPPHDLHAAHGQGGYIIGISFRWPPGLRANHGM